MVNKKTPPSRKRNSRDELAEKTMKELQSPKSIQLTKNNVIAARLVEMEPQNFKMGYAVHNAILNHPYLYSIYREMEWMGRIERIHIIHENLVDLCKLISTRELKKVDITGIQSGDYKVFTDMTYTIFIRHVSSNICVWLFEKERLIAARIKTGSIDFASGVGLINRKIRMIQAFFLLDHMEAWITFYPLQHRDNNIDKVVRWAHHKQYEEILAYWVSRGDKIEILQSNGIPVFTRTQFTRSIKQPDGKFKNVRESHYDPINTYDHKQLILNK